MSKFDDIINLPHYHDPRREYMSMSDRAAQFASYKALSGYEDRIEAKSDDVWQDDDWEQIDYSDSQEESEYDVIDEEFDD